MNKRTEALVLRRTNYGEADRIITFLTPEGQVSAIARGVRREKSKLAGGIELLGVSDITFHQGKGKLAVVTSARLVEFYDKILLDYDRLQFAYEALKLVERASKDLDESEWFTITKEVLSALNTLTYNQQLIELWFYLRYQAMLGEEVNLTTDTNGQPLLASAHYFYNIHEQGFEESKQGNLGADHIKLLRLIAAKPIRTIAQIGGIEEVLKECLAVLKLQPGR